MVMRSERVAGGRSDGGGGNGREEAALFFEFEQSFGVCVGCILDGVLDGVLAVFDNYLP